MLEKDKATRWQDSAKDKFTQASTVFPLGGLALTTSLSRCQDFQMEYDTTLL